MNETYMYYGYIIYPKEGKIISPHRGMNEVAKGKARLVIDISDADNKTTKRKIVKKLRAVYESVYGPQTQGVILYPKNGDETDARIDNIVAIRRADYFKNHDWSIKAKIDEATVEKIRADYATGNYSHAQLGHDYGCGKSTIQKIVNRQYYWDLCKNTGENKSEEEL